jgi:probable HAF family extracellular repeat protein
MSWCHARSLATLALASGLATQANAAAFTPIEIGNLGKNVVEVRAISDRGQVVGSAWTSQDGRAFSWTPATGMIDLGVISGFESAATFVAENGRVFGYEAFTPHPSFKRAYAYRAITWTREDGLSSIEPVHGVENYFDAVNTARGTGIGHACADARRRDCEPFFWSAETGALNIGQGLPSDLNCSAAGINRHDEVVGYCRSSIFSPRPPDRAYRWSPDAGLTFLPDLPAGEDCYAEAIADDGLAVGYCVVEDDYGKKQRQAVAWPRNSGPLAIPRLPSTETNWARWINASGAVVGQSPYWSIDRGFLWTPATGSLEIAPAGPAGYTLNTLLFGLTENGEVIGSATTSDGARQFAFAWSASAGFAPISLLDPPAQTYPRAWSARGQVTGYAGTTGFVWDRAAGAAELAPLPQGSGLPYSGTDAQAINNRGQVAGWSSDGTGYWTAVLWNTKPLPRTPLIAEASPASLPSGLLTLRNEPIALEALNPGAAAPPRSQAFHGAALVPLAAELLGDIDGNGVEDVVVLAARWSDAAPVAEIRNLTGTANRRRVTFAKGLEHRQLLVLPASLHDDGLHRLGVAGIRADGRPLVQIRETASGGGTRNLSFGATYAPVGFALLDDLNDNGNPEIALVGVSSTGRVPALVRDAATGQSTGQYSFASAYVPALAAGIDLDGDGGGNLLAVLGRQADGAVQAEIRNTTTGNLHARVGFTAGYRPLDLVVLPDINGNSAPELALLQISEGGDVRIEVRDATRGTRIRIVSLTDTLEPKSLSAIADLNGNGVPELVYLGEAEPGSFQRIAKDASTGAAVGSWPLTE